MWLNVFKLTPFLGQNSKIDTNNTYLRKLLVKEVKLFL